MKAIAKNQCFGGKVIFMPVKRILILLALVCSIIAVWTLSAIADNYAGKIDLVQVTAGGTRFFVRSTGLSLYATGEYRDVLLQGFYRKSNFSIG
jgi:hypothetical protein